MTHHSTHFDGAKPLTGSLARHLDQAPHTPMLFPFQRQPVGLNPDEAEGKLASPVIVTSPSAAHMAGSPAVEPDLTLARSLGGFAKAAPMPAPPTHDYAHEAPITAEAEPFATEPPRLRLRPDPRPDVDNVQPEPHDEKHPDFDSSADPDEQQVQLAGFDLLDFTGLRRLPLYRQSEAAECGLACLGMIAAYHGHRVSLAKLRQRFAISLKGATLAQIMIMADELGFAARPLRGEVEEIPELKLPAILHWDLNHFVVLKKIRRTLSGLRYHIHDPARGDVVYSAAELSKHWTGVCLELYKTTKFEPKKDQPKLSLKDLGANLSGAPGILVQALLLSVLLQGFAFAAPFYMQLAIDKAIPAFDKDFLWVIAMGFGGLAILNFFTKVLRDWLIIKLGNAMGFSMVSDLFRHMLRLPVSYFERRHTGDVLSRFESTEPITDMFANKLIHAVIDGVMAMATLVLMFYFAPSLAFIAVAALGVYIVLRLVSFQALRRASLDGIAAEADEQSMMMETIRGMPTIKLFGREADRLRLWLNRKADVINAKMRVERLNMGFEAASETVLRLETIVFLFFAVTLVLDARLTVGMIFAYQAYKQQFLDAAMRLTGVLIEYRMLQMHVDRIADIAVSVPEPEGELGRQRKPASGALELRDVHFAYGKDEAPLLKGANLSIHAGECIALVGPSGSGKSTLMKLILGMYEPVAGQVLADNVPIQKMGLRVYRQHCAAVLQDDVLYAGSLAENICFFDPQPDFDRIGEVARMACIEEEILRLPMGYDTLVGDMGSTLSGGQRQRVFLARALYHNPKILLLDEGTANLDVDSEAAVMRMITDLPVTRIMIAHRPQTIMAADRIVLLRDGQLHECPAGVMPDLHIELAEDASGEGAVL